MAQGSPGLWGSRSRLICSPGSMLASWYCLPTISVTISPKRRVRTASEAVLSVISLFFEGLIVHSDRSATPVLSVSRSRRRQQKVPRNLVRSRPTRTDFQWSSPAIAVRCSFNPRFAGTPLRGRIYKAGKARILAKELTRLASGPAEVAESMSQTAALPLRGRGHGSSSGRGIGRRCGSRGSHVKEIGRIPRDCHAQEPSFPAFVYGKIAERKLEGNSSLPAPCFHRIRKFPACHLQTGITEID
jgi:hypothetical protein